MKLRNRFYVWGCGWTRSQLWFLLAVNLWWLAVSLWAVYRFEVAREAAIYWQERAITNSVYHKP